MLANTWNNIFYALNWSGAILVLIYYFYPKFYEGVDPAKKNSPVYLTIGIYIAIWIIVLIIYNFYGALSNAEIKGLWKLKPEYARESVKFDHKSKLMVPANGMVELLSEKDSTEFLAETFTFGFFVSIDHSSIEGINGDGLKNDYKPYQLIVSVPGVYDIYVDPFHEMLSMEFYSYKSSKYTVNLPTLKTSKWHQILISVEGRSADIYQNGVLIRSVGLQNVIAARPGKPKVNMNPSMYASVAFVQSWSKRLKESEIVTNYRWNTDPKGAPPLPDVEAVNLPVISAFSLWDGFNFCIGSYCTDSISSETDALSYVNYTYA